MSIHNICFHGEIRKISTIFGKKKKCLIWSYVIVSRVFGGFTTTCIGPKV